MFATYLKIGKAWPQMSVLGASFFGLLLLALGAVASDDATSVVLVEVFSSRSISIAVFKLHTRVQCSHKYTINS